MLAGTLTLIVEGEERELGPGRARARRRPRCAASSSNRRPARICCCSRSAAPASTSAATVRRSSRWEPGDGRAAAGGAAARGRARALMRSSTSGRCRTRVVGRADRRRARPVRHRRRPDRSGAARTTSPCSTTASGRSPPPGLVVVETDHGDVVGVGGVIVTRDVPRAGPPAAGARRGAGARRHARPGHRDAVLRRVERRALRPLRLRRDRRAGHRRPARRPDGA